MKNSEKAKEIAENSKQYFYQDEYECGLACALRMAEWKDEQFMEFIEWIDNVYVLRRFSDGEPIDFKGLVEKFKLMQK